MAKRIVKRLLAVLLQKSVETLYLVGSGSKLESLRTLHHLSPEKRGVTTHLGISVGLLYRWLGLE